jgi:hypothetical protein
MFLRFFPIGLLNRMEQRKCVGLPTRICVGFVGYVGYFYVGHVGFAGCVRKTSLNPTQSTSKPTDLVDVGLNILIL